MKRITHCECWQCLIGRWTLFVVFIVLLFMSYMGFFRAIAHGQELPDAPIPHPESESAWHELRFPLIAMWGSNSVDAALTCQWIGANGWREYSLPTNSCGGVVGLLMAERAGLTLSGYLLAKHGHARVAKALLWTATATSAGYITANAVHKYEYDHRSKVYDTTLCQCKP